VFVGGGHEFSLAFGRVRHSILLKISAKTKFGASCLRLRFVANDPVTSPLFFKERIGDVTAEELGADSDTTFICPISPLFVHLGLLNEKPT
jgi:hypothetical protein